jgi:hypothetical protein
VLTVTALSAACSATPVRSAAPARTLVSCAGGTVDAPETAAAFAGCEVITGDLSIRGADLRDLGLLSDLREVTGKLSIDDNPKLLTLAGLESLSSVGELEVRQNERLESLSGLDSLSVAENVVISENPALENVAGLEGLGRLGRLELRDNGIATTAGLEGLEHVGSLVVRQNRALISLRGLSNVRSASTVEISQNPRLCAKLGLLPRLEAVTEKLSVTKNWGLSPSDVLELRDRVRHPEQGVQGGGVAAL